jgi:hypothetical protein
MALKSGTLRLAALILSTMLNIGWVAAADYETPPPATFFGNLHTSIAEAYFVESGASGYSWPEIDVGGKVAYQAPESRVGFQIDGNGTGHSYSWDSPGVPFGGARIETLMGLHGTYDVDDKIKLGFFANFETRNINQSKITDPAYAFDGRSNLSGTSNFSSNGSLGIEALYLFRPDAWVQGRVGLAKKFTDKTSWTDATTSVSSTQDFNVGQDYGYQLGFGAHVGLTDRLSLDGGVSFVSILPQSGGYDNAFAAALIGEYDFVDTGIAAYTQLQYQKYFSSVTTVDGYTIRTGLKWSLGDLTNTVRGKLFDSAGLFGHFN